MQHLRHLHFSTDRGTAKEGSLHFAVRAGIPAYEHGAHHSDGRRRGDTVDSRQCFAEPGIQASPSNTAVMRYTRTAGRDENLLHPTLLPVVAAAGLGATLVLAVANFSILTGGSVRAPFEHADRAHRRHLRHGSRHGVRLPADAARGLPADREAVTAPAVPNPGVDGRLRSTTR